jgi:NADH-quinone oxidoreductase subunit H
MVAAASLLAIVFLPFGLTLSPAIAFLFFIIKVLFVIALITLLRTVLARLRIDQMIDFCWKYLVPLALIQILINLILKAAILR